MKNRIQNTARFISAGACLLFSLLANHAGATVIYWDNNGTGTPSSGTWNTTTAQWAATSVLTASTIVWNTADAACFTAGATSPGAITITVNSAINCAGIFNGSLNPPGCTLTISGTGSLNTPSGLNWALDTSGSNGDPTTIAVPITGASVVTLEGGAPCFLHAANTYTGGTQLGFAGNAFASILNFNNSGAFGTGSIIVSNCPGGALLVEGASAMTITNALKVGQTNATYSQSLNIVGNPAGLTFSGPWNLGGFTLLLGSGNVAGNLVIISGVMSGGAGGITKFNPGTLELTAANTYTGVTTVNAGTLQLGDGTSLNGSVAGTITVTAPGSLVISNPLALTYSKVISGTGPVTKGAAGVLTLGAANTYAGLTTISGGTVKLGIANALPSGAGKGDVQLNGTLDMGAFSSGAGVLNGAGTVDNSTGVATYTLTIAGNGDSGNFSGIIQNTSGTVALTKTGVGSQILSGANTYAGNTIISAGTLQVGAANALPAASSVLVSSGATLDMNSQSDTVAALGGSGTVQNTAGTLTVNGNAATILTQNFNGYSCIAGTVSGSGSLVKGGTHAMAVRSDLSSYGGAISLTGGTLSVGAASNRLPTSLALAVPTGALFQLDANNQTLADLTGSGSVNLGGGILTVTPSATDTFSGVIQDSELAGSSTALGHGLRGYYYTNIDFTGLGTVRDDSTVNLPDMTSLPGYSPTAKTNQISIRWLGKVLTTVVGNYVFSTKCDDGARLWVNGTLLVDDPTTHGPTVKSGTNSFAANTQYDIVMEYFNNTAGGAAQLLWMPPGDTTSVIIPSSNLLLPGAGTFVMNGSGTQKLGGANTYSGGTVVNAGTLEVTAGGTLGSGNVTVNGGTTLTLDSSASIASAADLIVNSSTLFVNLNYSGTDNISALSLDGGATYQPAGIYGATASNPTGVFTGTGLIHVSAGPTTTTLVSSPSSPATVAYGTTVTLTATVSGGATPSGTVTFYDGANWLGTGSLVSGVATFNVNNLLVEFSPHSLTAVYSGDATHAASTSAAVTVSTTPGTLVPTVIIANKIYDATTTATIASLAGMLPSDSNYVHVASYNATFSDKEAGTGKTVTIINMVLAGSLAGEYTMSTTATNATANITPKALKVFNITAANKVYDATTAATITTTTAALGVAEAVGTGTTADGTNYIGDTVTVVTTGAVGTFADPNVANGKTVTINGLTLSGAQAGDYTVTPPTTTANITKANSAGALTSSSNPSSQGANVTFTETLSAAAGTPTGGVTFWTNNVFLGTNVLVSGVASTNTAALPVGSTTVQARYTGDVNFVGITNSLTQVVNAATTAPTTISNIFGTTLSYGGGAGAQFVLLGTNNVAAPLANWPRLATNTTTPGNFTIPAVGSAGPTFYRIKSE
jgi:fibronectin-binding autotransporter adhesin